jgi:hypothetical protein
MSTTIGYENPPVDGTAILTRTYGRVSETLIIYNQSAAAPFTPKRHRSSTIGGSELPLQLGGPPIDHLFQSSCSMRRWRMPPRGRGRSGSRMGGGRSGSGPSDSKPAALRRIMRERQSSVKGISRYAAVRADSAILLFCSALPLDSPVPDPDSFVESIDPLDSPCESE